MSGQKKTNPQRRLKKFTKEGEREENYISNAKGAVTFKREVYITPNLIEKLNRLKIKESLFNWADRSSDSFAEGI